LRKITADDLKGYDSVVQLAEFSIDPLGQLNLEITFGINHQGSVRIAKLYKTAEVELTIYRKLQFNDSTILLNKRHLFRKHIPLRNQPVKIDPARQARCIEDS